MKIRVLKSMLLAAMILAIHGCLDPYTPQGSATNVNYLVVEGFLNSQGATVVNLSRTSIISSESSSQKENGAVVTIESEDGQLTQLNGDNNGGYSHPGILLDVNKLYRLNITTQDQTTYESDFIPLQETQPIDTIRYEVTGEDIQFYLTSHDDLAKSRYYQWKYIETWQYNSAWQSQYIFQNQEIVARPDPNEIFYCWSTEPSGEILISSSARLEKDIIFDLPFRKLNIHDKKFYARYSLLVKQYAITKEAYNYWEQLKKSTETNGSIFDPLPSQTPTNIHNMTHPETPAVGFFSAGNIQTKRIFISHEQLPNVSRLTGYEECRADTLLLVNVPNFDGSKLVAYGVYPPHGAQIIGYSIATPACIDCRYHGGTNIKPDFW